MSALGQKQTFAVKTGMSDLPPKADICSAQVRCPLCAKSGHQVALFDHLVGVTEPRRRHSETQGFRRPNLFPGGLRNVVIQK